MKTEKEYVVWSNLSDNVSKYIEDLKLDFPEYTENQLYESAYEALDTWLEDEHHNLNIPTDGQILVIADLGLWNGRKSGYRILNEKNINACFGTHYDYTKWYVDKYGDFRCMDIHHDGTNHYLYREIKQGISAKSMESLLSKIYGGTVTRADITRCTKRLGDRIGKVYGWDFPNRKRTAQPVR